MLARLLRLPGIGSIDVDHSGTVVRLRIADVDPDPVVDAVTAVLRLEGYAGTPLAGEEEASATRRIEAWHGTNAASELSREEAQVLAAQITAAFARERKLVPAAAERLRRTVAERLYGSFTAPDAASHVGELVGRAFPGIVAEARAYLGAAEGSALEAFLASWRARPERGA